MADIEDERLAGTGADALDRRPRDDDSSLDGDSSGGGSGGSGGSGGRSFSGVRYGEIVVRLEPSQSEAPPRTQPCSPRHPRRLCSAAATPGRALFRCSALTYSSFASKETPASVDKTQRVPRAAKRAARRAATTAMRATS